MAVRRNALRGVTVVTLVREPVLRGVRAVDALLFEGPNCVQLALERWQPGSTLFTLGSERLILRWPEPAWLRCELGDATPLVDAGGGRLVALPLGEAELVALPPASLTSLRGGTLVTEAAGPPIDPTSLLDVRDWRAATPHRTSSTPDEAVREPVPPPLAAPPRAFDARGELGGGNEPTQRDRRQWDRLTTQRPQGRAAAERTARGQSAVQPGFLHWLYRRRHERYLNELTRLFAAGQYEEALRRAIPFGGEGGRLARSGPQRRRDLQLDPRRAPASSSLPIEPGLRAELQTRYRAAFKKLEAEGRVREAAFVLAELLDQASEACSFLERHGEIRLAAELAEARAADPADAVRLWWRAGERQRAIVLARRRGCFAPAITRLERSGFRDEATALRRAWTSHLLDAGDIVGAYDASAGLEEEADRRVRRRLIDLGIAQGGPLRARMLARQMRLQDDEPHPDLIAAVDDPEAGRDLELILAEVTQGTDRVAHPQIVRSIVRRCIAERRDVDRTQLRQAIELAEDPVLRTDLPPLEHYAPRPKDDLGTTWVEIDASDRGLIGVRDARLLPDGRLVLALAGIGIRVVRKSGHIEAEFDVPADGLITSDNGLRLLAVQALGEQAVGVSSIALPERKIQRLGELPATTWAQTYDGANWFLAHHDQLWMLDMLPEGPTALWRQEHSDGPIIGIARDASDLVVASGSGIDPRDGSPVAAIHRYALPSLQEVDVLHRPFWLGGVLLPSGDVADGAAASERYRARVETTEGEPPTVVATKVHVEAPVAVVRLAGVGEVRTRIDADTLVVFDDIGRVELLDLGDATRRSYRATV